MSVTQVRQSVGSWSVRLRGNIPKRLLAVLEPFGHIAIVPGSVNVKEHGDNLLDAARYVGVYRSRADNEGGVTIGGVGLESWLGDENGAGDVFETPLELEAVTFAAAIAAALPAGGAITAGTIHSIAGTYSGRHQWVTSRKILDYITQLYEAEWRVNNDGTLDAGTVAQLYSTTPSAILVAKNDSSDLRYRALPGNATMSRENQDYTTRVVVLGEGEGETIQVGTADQPSVPYKDIHGNEMVVTRVFSESTTTPVNVDTRAQVLLDQYGQPQAPNINLSTSTYDMKGEVQVGDYIYVYNPDAGFEDAANETTWNGELIHPAKLRVVELSWPIRAGWTVAYRDGDGVWTDLSQYVFFEGGDTNVVVGDLPRSLTGGGVTEPIGTRPSVDTTIPNSPEFTAFNFGSYQSDLTNTTKAAIRMTWTTPLNIDGSTVVDGDHYEIRYRVSAVLGYRVKWGQIGVPSSNPYKWGELLGNPWGAPVSDPVEDDPKWYTSIVAWGTNDTTIAELTPGVTYELQIRAVDQSAHLGPWSGSSFVTTIGDMFAPSTPAPPSVAASRIAIQVTHHLGKASGGTFNLEQDLDHLEIHVGGSNSFYPDESTLVGKLTANASMLGAGIPAVGTFQVEQTEQVHIKVRAVDRSGNKSSGSESATATAELIDDAHISDLTVSKITAGTISATWIMAGAIKTADTGPRVEITNAGVKGYDVDGVESIEMDTDGTFRVKDAATDTRVEMGRLTDGTYGLAAVNDLGQLVPLSRLAFGVKYAYRHDLCRYQSTTYGDATIDFTGLVTPGPSMTDVAVGDLGIMLIFITARIFIASSSSFPITSIGAYVSFQVTNQNTGAVVWSPSDSWSATFGWSASNTAEGYDATVATIYPLTGLDPGIYTVTAKYRTIDGDRAHYENVGMIAFPF